MGGGMLSMELIKLAEENNWKEYTRLCIRSNIYPKLFAEYLSKRYDLSCIEPFEELITITILSRHSVSDLRFLEEISIKNLITLEIFKPEDSFSLTGLVSTYLPSLKILRILLDGGNVEELGEFRSNSLTHLYLSLKNLTTPILNFPRLKTLAINSDYLNIVDVLNSSNIPIISHIHLSGVIDSSNLGTMTLGDIDWLKYLKLEKLWISKSDFNTIIFTEELNCLTSLSSIIVDCMDMRVEGIVRLENVTNIRLATNDVNNLNGLELPNLEHIELFFTGPYGMFGDCFYLKSLIKSPNAKVTISR